MITDTDIRQALLDTLRQRDEMTLPATGISMGPRFTGTEALVVQRADVATLRTGDIIVYAGNDRWIAHRIIWRFRKQRKAFCATKGDGAGLADYPGIQSTEVIGLVVGIKKMTGWNRYGRARAYARPV